MEVVASLSSCAALSSTGQLQMQSQDESSPHRHLDEFAAALADLTKSSDSIRHAATLGMQAAGAWPCSTGSCRLHKLTFHFD